MSDGISEVMDDYVGQNIEDVRNILSKYPNLRVVAEAVGDAAEPGTIISQSGIEAMQEFDPAKNNTIYFKYSEYQSYIIPFELIGMNLNDAKYLLDSMNITYVIMLLFCQFSVFQFIIFFFIDNRNHFCI